MGMRVSDYIARRLAYLGIRRCFSVTGGGAMHLNDSFGEVSGIECTYLHHEQACAIAAEGYARISGRPAAVVVTSGPGAINAINGVFGAYTDSIPIIVISGQVKTETLVERASHLPLRQLGDQEAQSGRYIPAFVKSFCSLRSASEVSEAVDFAFNIATSGRPGPCWIEVPVDIQGAKSDELEMLIDSPLADQVNNVSVPSPRSQDVQSFLSLLAESKRPLLLLGTGVRLSRAQQEVIQFAENQRLPIVTAWTHDTCDNTNDLFVGRPGTIGTRPGNFAVQSCDLLVVLGSRLNIRQVSYNWSIFAHHAKIVMVDIDESELYKPYLNITLPIHSDVRHFVKACADSIKNNPTAIPNNDNLAKRREWIQRLRKVCEDYTVKYDDYKLPPPGTGINPYHFIFALAGHMKENHRIVCGDATACIVPYQILPLRNNQRMFSNSGCASMGYDLPAGIGAALAARDYQESGPTIILAGDGSLMMNLQELQSLRSSGLDIVLFILDNNGYLSIKQTQSNFFGREHGASPRSGVTFPDFAQVAEAFGLPVKILDDQKNIDHCLEALIHEDTRPRVCVVKIFEGQEFEPRLKSKIIDGVICTPELDDMYPHLPSEELQSIRSFLLGTSPLS